MNRAPITRLLAVSCAIVALSAALPGSSSAFSLFTRADLPVGFHFRVITTDLNRDGALDLVALSGAGTVSVLLGNGDGTFDPPATVDVGDYPSSVAAGDINGDAIPDLLVGKGASVSVLIGVGDGTFGPPSDFQTGAYVPAMGLADFNSDGRLDVVVEADNRIFVRLGNGDGTFGPQIDATIVEGCGGDILTADLNADGKLDLTIINCSSATILLGNGDGTFRPPVNYPVADNLEFYGDVGDLNGDGRPDLVISNVYPSTVISVLMGNGDGTFLPKVDFDAGLDPDGVKIGDFNSDGIPDLAVAAYAVNTLALLAGRGDGTFESKIGFPTGFYPFVLEIGDWNRDSLLDLVVLTEDGPSLFLNATGPPAGNPPVLLAPPTVTGQENSLIMFTVTASDPDGDPLLNLAAADPPGGATFTVDATNTSGTFSWTPPIGSGPYTYPTTFVAYNTLSVSARIDITVEAVNQPPVLSQPSNMTVNEGAVVDQFLTATDPNGDALTFSKVAGPTFMTVTSIDATSGNIHLAPGLSDAGSYSGTVRASDGTLSDDRSITITVNEAGGQVIFDDFNDNSIDLSRWAISPTGSGTTVVETNQRLEIAHAANSADDGTGSFGISLLSVSQLTGDYDIQVDFHLLDWPFANGVRVALVTRMGTTEGATQRVSFGTPADFPGAPREVYATDFNTGAYNLVNTTDLSGKLRQVRSGSTLTGYYWSNGAWVALGSASVTAQNVSLGVASWSHGYAFTDQFARVAFDDFIVNQGQFTTPNQPPVLATIGNKTVNELSPLTFTATATDPDASQTLTFSLDAGGPAGASINGSSAAFSWIPSELQGPGQYPITVRVTDNGAPALSDFETISVTVNESNVAPILFSIGNKATAVGIPLTFTATATDPDIPANSLSFSLDPGAPVGATIGSSSGVFNWTPSSTGTFPVTVRVTDGGPSPLSDFEPIQISVCSNCGNPPVLAAIGNRTVNEQASLTFTATATDPDAGQMFTFTLDAGSPAGASINGSTGAFSWIPSEVQGPGQFPITVRVTDNGNPPFTDSETIAVTVIEVNTAPILIPIGNKTATLGTPFSFTAVATDADYPANGYAFSLDPGAPAGATIGALSGIFNWTPGASGTFPVTVRIADTGSPPLDDFEAITITVSGGGPNQPPVLAAIGNKTVNEIQLLTFTATATDANAGQTLTFSLDPGLPTGATIGSSTGAFSWTPTEAQGPGQFPITVRVTDNGAPAFSDVETITVTVNEVNLAPVLAPIGDKVTPTGVLLTFTATATDADIPANTLFFSLDAGAPAGATINSGTGVFNWTPASTGTFPVTIRVTDNGTPNLSDFEAIQIAVCSTCGNPPVLASIGSRSVTELTLLNFTATATDPDAGQTLTFSLAGGVPAGAAIGGSTGAFTWTPTEAQGPGSYSITVRVTDNGSPPLSDSETITVNVIESNSVPVLAAIGNKSGTVGALLTFTATATDADLPANVLTFSLDPGAPADAVISASGSFAWTPTCGQLGTFPVTIRVTDNGPPPLSDFEAITITITGVGNPPPVLAIIGNKTVNEGTLLNFTATATDPDAGNVLTFSLDAGAPAGTAINGGSGVFTWTPTEVQGPLSHSITVRVTDNGVCPASDSETITVLVNEVNVTPVLAAIGDRFVAAGTPLTFTATATDVDIPANVLTFSLDAGAPAGATIGTSSGVFNWTPPAAGIFPLTIRVTDNGTPALSDFEAIQISACSSCGAPPVLGAIGNRTVNEHTNLAFTATATDPDAGQTLTFSLSLGTPAATGATINASTGAFSWTPTEFQGPGQFPITVRVTDNFSPPLSDTETIQVTVNEVNAAPVLAAIGNKTGAIGVPITFTATATDADIPANTLTFSLDAGAPAGATINASTGAFSWTPSTTGTNPVTIRVTDNGTPPLSDFEAITIVLGGAPNQAPLVTNPGNQTVFEGANLAFTVTATDPDAGQTLTFSLNLGTPAATGATIQASTGAFSWTPAEVHGPGIYPVTITATDNGSPVMSGSAAITVTVPELNNAPVLSAIGNKTVDVGTTLAFTATATDADIPANTLAFSLDAGAPVGATITGTTGAFSWTPSFAQIGVFPITVRVTDNGSPSLSDSETITVLAILVDGHPSADAGGPYSGIVNTPVSFDGTGSSDPAGQALTYAWDFGDGGTGVSVTPMHVYTAPGVYNIILRVTDPDGNFDEATTTVTITDGGPGVRVVLKNGKTTLNLGDKDVVKVGIEEVELPYTDVIVGTVRLSTDFPNAGTVPLCAADPKHGRVGDLDRNGVPDLEVRFPIACVRNLFRNTPNNTNVNLILTGEFETGTGTVPFRGVMVVTIRTGGGAVPVLAYPNPFNPQGRLSFVTTRPGDAMVQLFDLQGRLVRTLMPQQYLGAGVHEVAIDGRNDQGHRLPSGVYFYRVLTADGPTEGSISVLK